MKVLLVGSTGMLGQALNKKIVQCNIELITVSRTNATYNIDLVDQVEKLNGIIKFEKPDVVINSAAMINLKGCEDNPDIAYKLNARLPALIEIACREINSYFVQISTDHYYVNGEGKRHTEKDEVVLLNEYARTKYAGEAFTLINKNTLVARTNIVGFRNKKNEPTFIEWVIKSLHSCETITGFDNFFASSIDVDSFASILMELIQKKVTGVINIASADVSSKFDFIYEFAKKIGKEQYVIKGEIKNFQGLKRADSLGLDTTKLQSILNNQQVPNTKQVIEILINKYKEGAFYELSK